MVLMGLRRQSPLACSINMKGGARGARTPYTPPHETLVAASSQLNSEALATRVVLAHPHVVFDPYMCGLHGGAAALIGYDDVEVAVRTTMRRRRS
jgi:hypothetical protein